MRLDVGKRSGAVVFFSVSGITPERKVPRHNLQESLETESSTQ